MPTRANWLQAPDKIVANPRRNSFQAAFIPQVKPLHYSGWCALNWPAIYRAFCDRLRITCFRVLFNFFHFNLSPHT